MTEGMWAGGPDEDARLASDPAATGADLARLAAQRPDLRPALARNPATYPALVEWLRALHQPEVDAALAARPPTDVAPAAPATPAPPATAGPAAPAWPASAGQPGAASPYGGGTAWSPQPLGAGAEPGSGQTGAQTGARPSSCAPGASPYAPYATPGAAYAAPGNGYGAPGNGYAAPGAPWSRPQGGYGAPADAGWDHASGSAPLASGSVPVYVGPPERRRRTGMKVAAGAVAAAVVVGAAVGGYALVGSRLRGASSPEAAVTRLFDGLAAQDLAAAAGSLSPADLGTAVTFFSGAVDRADPGADALGPLQRVVDAFELSVDGLEVRSTSLDEGLAQVAITGGSVTIDGDADEIVAALTAVVGDTGAEGLLATMLPDGATLATDLAGALPHTLDFADLAETGGEPPFLVAVQEGGRWYVSPLMTLGEYAVRTGGLTRGAMPDPADVVRPADPVEAARQFAEALEPAAAGDLGPLASVLPLAERRFVAVYGQAAVDEAIAQSGSTGTRLRMTATGFELVGQDGDTATVLPSDVAFEVEQDGQTTTVATDGTCVTVTGPSEPTHVCASDLPVLGMVGLSQFPLTAVKEGTGWYVSVSGTVGSWLMTMSTAIGELSDQGALDAPGWWSGQLPEGLDCEPAGACDLGGLTEPPA